VIFEQIFVTTFITFLLVKNNRERERERERERIRLKCEYESESIQKMIVYISFFFKKMTIIVFVKGWK